MKWVKMQRKNNKHLSAIHFSVFWLMNTPAMLAKQAAEVRTEKWRAEKNNIRNEHIEK